MNCCIIDLYSTKILVCITLSIMTPTFTPSYPPLPLIFLFYCVCVCLCRIPVLIAGRKALYVHSFGIACGNYISISLLPSFPLSLYEVLYLSAYNLHKTFSNKHEV